MSKFDGFRVIRQYIILVTFVDVSNLVNIEFRHVNYIIV